MRPAFSGPAYFALGSQIGVGGYVGVGVMSGAQIRRKFASILVLIQG